MTEQHIGRLQISYDLLLQALHLPADTRILAAQHDWNTLTLIVEHPGIPAVAKDCAIPYVDLRLRRQDEVVFEGWQ